MFDAHGLRYPDPEAHWVPCRSPAITSRFPSQPLGSRSGFSVALNLSGEKEKYPLPACTNRQPGLLQSRLDLNKRPTTTVAGYQRCACQLPLPIPCHAGCGVEPAAVFRMTGKTSKNDRRVASLPSNELRPYELRGEQTTNQNQKKQLRQIRYSTSRCDLIICQISRSKKGREMSENRRTTTLPKALREITINRTK